MNTQSQDVLQTLQALTDNVRALSDAQLDALNVKAAKLARVSLLELDSRRRFRAFCKTGFRSLLGRV